MGFLVLAGLSWLATDQAGQTEREISEDWVVVDPEVPAEEEPGDLAEPRPVEEAALWPAAPDPATEEPGDEAGGALVLQPRRPRMPAELGWLQLLCTFYFLAVFSGVEFANQQDPEGLSIMPAAGETRYYRTGPVTGLELELMRRFQPDKKYWVVMLPDVSLRRVDLSHRPSVATQPVANVDYLPRPVLGAAKRQEGMASASRMGSGQEPCRVLDLYGRPPAATHL